MNRYEVNGHWYTVNELAEMSGMLPHTLRDRLRRGYSVEEAIKPMATHDSVKEFCDASHWEDFIGMSTAYLYEIYWKWSVSQGMQPTTKQGFSRHLFQKFPMLKAVPTKSANGYMRVIRLRG